MTGQDYYFHPPGQISRWGVLDVGLKCPHSCVHCYYAFLPDGSDNPKKFAGMRRADWKGDPEFTEDCFPLIYRHTGGVPRQINTLCSRLLLFGFLEQLHTLQANAVEKVANDLREEIAVVTTEPIGTSTGGQANGKSEAVSEIAERLSVLEQHVDRHGRVIKRAIEIAASYFQGDRP